MSGHCYQCKGAVKMGWCDAQECNNTLALLAAKRHPHIRQYYHLATHCTSCCDNPELQAHCPTQLAQRCAACASSGGSARGAECHFPFTYKGETHPHCIKSNSRNGASWCATTADFRADKLWGRCPDAGKGCSRYNPQSVSVDYGVAFTALGALYGKQAYRLQGRVVYTDPSPMVRMLNSDDAAPLKNPDAVLGNIAVTVAPANGGVGIEYCVLAAQYAGAGAFILIWYNDEGVTAAGEFPNVTDTVHDRAEERRMAAQKRPPYFNEPRRVYPPTPNTIIRWRICVCTQGLLRCTRR